MRSKTSFFNGEIIRRTVFRRYWPIMAVYGLAAAFAAFILAYMTAFSYDGGYASPPDESQIEYFRSSLVQMAAVVGGIGGAMLGIVLARISFGYLFNSEQVQFFHALPLKRESLFFSNFTAGALLFTIPILFGWLMLWLFSAFLGVTWLIAPAMLPILLVLLAVHLFFYSFAVLVAHLTGHGVAHMFIYCVFNFLSIFLYRMITVLLREYLFGLNPEYLPEIVDNIAFNLSPVFGLLTRMNMGIVELSYAYGIAGLVFIPVSLLLYKKRSLETCGDVIAFNFLKPFFQAGFALCFTLIFSVFLVVTEIGLPETALSIMILIFALIGYYAGRMLIHKTFRVFKGSFISAGAFMAIAVLCVCALQFDFIGYERRVPQRDEVEFVVCVPNNYYFYEEYDETGIALNRPRYNYYFSEQTPPEHFDPLTGEIALLARSLSRNLYEESDGIEAALELHGQIVDNRDLLERTTRSYAPDANPYGSYFTFVYMLKDGTILQREYNNLRSEEVALYAPAAEKIFNNDESVTNRLTHPLAADGEIIGGAIVDVMNEVTYNNGETPVLINQGFDAKAAQELYAAILADAQNGDIGAYYAEAKGAFEEEVSFISAQIFFRAQPHPFLQYHSDALPRSSQETNQSMILKIGITSRSANVLAWMEKQGIDASIVTQKRELPEYYSIYNWHNGYSTYIGSITRDYNYAAASYTVFTNTTN